MAAITQSIKRLLPTNLPPVLKPGSGNLYEVLSRTPSGGVGSEVHQTRWSHKNIDNCYWVVTRSVFKCEGKHGKAWGRLYWRGKEVSPREERIPGSLKYSWKEGRSIIGNKDLLLPSKKPLPQKSA
ncbi:hypothetical protein D9613_005391 [Agrocybe pediades]|uniref:Uncharacterized protein n=1 Tax=Agrocybe pediades TaxID=84607 RepID=A0A8H4VTC1_9AGAR|nr:hypothetical protein D9613_005391 [Agrocybe pediades]KAF9569386.1 hypothetical protein CPC08DRAFT_653390 [Agrocybe pediades]